MREVGALAGVLVVAGLAALGSGQERTQRPEPAREDEIQGLHFPQTAEDHQVVADSYEKLAASHRKEANLHRRMLAAYERLVADLAALPPPPPKRGKTFPSGKRAESAKEPVAEYRKHCEAYVRGAEALADEAQWLAEFHRARSRELSEPKDP